MTETNSNATSVQIPDYRALARFLLEPFLDYPENLKISCETFSKGTRFWLRISMQESDRGRAYGRGGRNIQSIRQVLEGVGKASGHIISVEIHEDSPRVRPSSSRSDSREKSKPSRPQPKL